MTAMTKQVWWQLASGATRVGDSSKLCMVKKRWHKRFAPIQRGTEAQSNKASSYIWAGSNKHTHQTTITPKITPPSFANILLYFEMPRQACQIRHKPDAFHSCQLAQHCTPFYTLLPASAASQTPFLPSCT